MVVATGYDFPFARILEESGVDAILVGRQTAEIDNPRLTIRRPFTAASPASRTRRSPSQTTS